MLVIVEDLSVAFLPLRGGGFSEGENREQEGQKQFHGRLGGCWAGNLQPHWRLKTRVPGSIHSYSLEQYLIDANIRS